MLTTNAKAALKKVLFPIGASAVIVSSLSQLQAANEASRSMAANTGSMGAIVGSVTNDPHWGDGQPMRFDVSGAQAMSTANLPHGYWRSIDFAGGSVTIGPPLRMAP